VYFLCECFYVNAFISFGIVEHQSCNAQHTDGVGYPTHTQIENQLSKNKNVPIFKTFKTIKDKIKNHKTHVLVTIVVPRELRKRPKALGTQLPSKGRVTINKYIHKSFFLL
jgi:hypothetical protein